MGTYTTNYNLFLPTIGEQGWGDLVNGNFTTIDSTMGNLNTRLTAVENEVNGALSCTSVTTSGTITSAGKITGNGGIGTTSLTTSSTITSNGLITANGGITGNLTGNVTGFLFVKGTVGTSGDDVYASYSEYKLAVSRNANYTNTSPGKFTIPNYSVTYPNYKKHTHGVYTRKSDLTGMTNPSTSTRIVRVDVTYSGHTAQNIKLYYRLQGSSSWNSAYIKNDGNVTYISTGSSDNMTLQVGNVYEFYLEYKTNSGYFTTSDYNIVAPASTTNYYVKYATP